MNKKNLWTLVGVICLAVVLTLLVLPGCAKSGSTSTDGAQKPVQSTEWKVTTFATPGMFWYDTHIRLGDLITKMSDGRLTLKLYAADQLYPVDKALENTGKGVTEMAATVGLYFGGVEPAFTLCYMPGTVLPMDGELYWENLPERQEIWQSLYNKYNDQWVGSFWAGARGTVLSKKPVNRLDDYKSITMRSTGDAAALFSKFGAKVVDLPAPEVYTALATGTIDAFELGDYTNSLNLSLQEVTKYMIEPTLHEGWGFNDYIVNRDVWNKLPADLQNIIQGAAATQMMPEEMSQLRINMQSRQKLLDAGLQVCTLPQEDVVKAYNMATALWNEMAARDATSAQLIKMYKDVCAIWGLK